MNVSILNVSQDLSPVSAVFSCLKFGDLVEATNISHVSVMQELGQVGRKSVVSFSSLTLDLILKAGLL